jgi:hypothetical protein
MTANYVLLEKITVGAANASSITFSGIPQTGYTDLVVKMSARGTHSVVFLNAVTTFNGSGGTAYSGLLLYGDGSNAGYGGFSAAGQTTYGFIPGSQSTSNTFSNNEIYIPNYTSSNYKSALYDMVHETNATTAYTGNQSVLWANTAAITSITLAPTSGSFAQYSTFYLYGVAKLGTTPAIVPYATGGNTIMTDGTYWYHTFISSGTFTPAKAITCDYLVVAGGGAGGEGNNASGGGGAGGLRSTVTATGGGGTLETPLSLTAQNYTVTVGAGGAGSSGARGGSGSNSVFSTITSTGGGGGGGSTPGPTSGGSGGSGGGGSGGTTVAATGTANQGFDGGFASNGGYAGSGGGGAGAVGVNATGSGTSAIAGAGGAGVAVSITGSSVTYAGGGGGADHIGGNFGAGGTGGGGRGESAYTVDDSVAGTANTGGGGGGSDNTPRSGGSGIVIVRYSV